MADHFNDDTNGNDKGFYHPRFRIWYEFDSNIPPQKLETKQL